MNATLSEAMATETDASASKRSGLYSKPAPTEKTTSAPTPSEATGLYSPLRAAPTGGGAPRPDEGIGTEVPVGNMPGAVLLVIASAYLGFVFIRKRNELRVNSIKN